MEPLRMQQLTIASAFCACILLSNGPALAASGNGASEKVFLGYVAGLPNDIDYSLYTHLCHAFVVAEKDGTLLPQENVPSCKLTCKAHRAGVKVLLSLGGWGWDSNFNEMSLHRPAEDRYICAVIALVDKYDYDGIDLDWEYPDTNIEIVGFERLARRFRQHLDELEVKKHRPMLLTMAAAAHPQTLKWLSNEFLLETMDWVNIMTYDYVGSWADFAGHHSPMFASSKLPKDNLLSTELTMKHLLEERKLPANRLALGIPLYGRVFAVSKPYTSTADAPKPDREHANYKEIHLLHEQQNWKRWWDDESKNPWLIAPDKSEIICYDDSESIAVKADWAKKHGLRGVFFWQIDADRMPDGSNPLQQTAHESLIQAARPE